MGFDVYGVAFNADYEKDSAFFDEVGVEEYLNTPAEKRPWRQDLPGRYFQTSNWGWRALALYICTTFPEIASQCKHWQTNDGDGLNEEMALRLADALDRVIETGTLADHIAMREAHIRNQPMRLCRLCHGSGIRTDESADEITEHRPVPQRLMVIPEDAKDAWGEGPHPRAGQTGWCNGCDGRGHRLPRDADYPLTVEETKRFAEFCRHSGGFEIS